jgi:adenylosuccinate lyase
VIDRYSRPEMSKIWSDQRKFEIWLEIEVLACEAMAELCQIPKEDAAEVRKRARFSIPKILEIEKRTNHDVIAFLENVAESVGPASRWIHQGLTSSDILDTTLAVQLNESCRILLDDLEALRGVIANQARRYKMTPMIGRSHGVHAEPITFGLKLALMYDEFGRAIERLTQTRERIRVGKISGAVGTHAHIDPKIERSVCERLGLKPATLSTQIVQRDRHAEFMTTLALIASSIDRWATEFRHLQRTEVLEVEEFFGEGQKGSSAMPHKRNPITNERLSGLARVIRGNAVVALENVALWHERDISHSSVERVILPDSTILIDHLQRSAAALVQGMVVDEQRMRANLELTHGALFSQRVLLALVAKGMKRDDAYRITQELAQRAWDEGTPLRELLAADERAAGLDLEEIFDYAHYTRYAAEIVGRLDEIA